MRAGFAYSQSDRCHRPSFVVLRALWSWDGRGRRSSFNEDDLSGENDLKRHQIASNHRLLAVIVMRPTRQPGSMTSLCFSFPLHLLARLIVLALVCCLLPCCTTVSSAFIMSPVATAPPMCAMYGHCNNRTTGGGTADFTPIDCPVPGPAQQPSFNLTECPHLQDSYVCCDEQQYAEFAEGFRYLEGFMSQCRACVENFRTYLLPNVVRQPAGDLHHHRSGEDSGARRLARSRHPQLLDDCGQRHQRERVAVAG